jgi:hypothetical protein
LSHTTPLHLHTTPCPPSFASAHTVLSSALHSVRVERALSLESDLVTHSASRRVRLSHVMPSPPTHPRPRLTLVLVPRPRPRPRPLPRLRPHPSRSLFKTPQHKPCRCHAVRPPSPPDDTHASLDTGQVAPCTSRSTLRPSNVPARGIQFFGHIVVYGIIDFASVCFHLSYFCV